MYGIAIDRELRRVLTTWGPLVTDDGLMTYQKTVWRDPALQDFDEVIDFQAIEEVEVTTEGLEAVAHVAARMDPHIGQGRFAIVVGDSLSFGLSRMYEAFREMHATVTRRVMIFHRLADALTWLEEKPATD